MEIEKRFNSPVIMRSASSPNPTPGLPSPLLQNLLLFGRMLRRLGLRVTSGQLIELANALRYIDIGSRPDFQAAARSLLVNRQEDVAIFNQAFDLFWRSRLENSGEDRWEEMPAQTRAEVPRHPGTTAQPRGTWSRQWGEVLGVSEAGEEEDLPEGEGTLALYSPGEVLRHKDFALFSPGEVEDARRFLADVRWDITLHRSRRPRAARRGRRLDVRRTIRRSLRHGGEMLDLAHRGPKMKRRPVVLLCDISGSMDRYTRLLLHFLHSVEHRLSRAEVFVFGTRLTRITPELRRRNPDAAIAAAAELVQDWSGGTRIGESIRTFNRRWARRVLGQGAIVLVISDGWDRGDPGLLAAEMERLQRQSYRLLWLNPLLGAPEYRPLTQGIQAALPYVDDFLPAHNLASLERLARLLNEVQEGRPERRQVRQAPEGIS